MGEELVAGAPLGVAGPVLTDGQFRKIAAIVHQDSGIILSESKRSLLMARLNRRLRVLTLPDYGAYCDRLEGPDGPQERRHLLSAITTVDRVNAIVLAGGSAFGLDAAGGVMRWLEDRGAGWPTPAGFA